MRFPSATGQVPARDPAHRLDLRRSGTRAFRYEVPVGAHPGVHHCAISPPDRMREHSRGLWRRARRSPGSAFSILHPVYNTNLCLAVTGPENAGRPLGLAACDGSASQHFIAAAGILESPISEYLVTSADGSFCLDIAAGTAKVRDIVLGQCTGKSVAKWETALSVLASASEQFEQIRAYLPGGVGQLAMDIAGTGGTGSGVVIGSTTSPLQLWTDLAPGKSAPGNPDGSIDIRPWVSRDYVSPSLAATIRAAHSSRCRPAAKRRPGVPRPRPRRRAGADPVLSPARVHAGRRLDQPGAAGIPGSLCRDRCRGADLARVLLRLAGLGRYVQRDLARVASLTSDDDDLTWVR
jgi:hypothetical protein